MTNCKSWIVYGVQVFNLSETHHLRPPCLCNERCHDSFHCKRDRGCVMCVFKMAYFINGILCECVWPSMDSMRICISTYILTLLILFKPYCNYKITISYYDCCYRVIILLRQSSNHCHAKFAISVSNQCECYIS